MSFGDFLQQMVAWAYEIFWPFRIIQEWEQGVRLRSGNVTYLCTSKNGIRGTGIHAYWPVIGEIISEDCNTRVVETPWQTVGGTSWTLAARYKIRDLGKLYVEIQDHEDTIVNVIASAAAELAGMLDGADHTETEFTHEVKRLAANRLTKWGVTLLEVSLYNRVEANALRLLQE